MFFLNETLNRNPQITAMVTRVTTTCGAGLFALIALVAAMVAVVYFGLPCGAIMGEQRTPSAPLSIPSDPVMNPLHIDVYCRRRTLPAPGLEVMR